MQPQQARDEMVRGLAIAYSVVAFFVAFFQAPAVIVAMYLGAAVSTLVFWWLGYRRPAELASRRTVTITNNTQESLMMTQEGKETVLLPGQSVTFVTEYDKVIL